VGAGSSGMIARQAGVDFCNRIALGFISGVLSWYTIFYSTCIVVCALILKITSLGIFVIGLHYIIF
jgi:hypothetical protein